MSLFLFALPLQLEYKLPKGRDCLLHFLFQPHCLTPWGPSHQLCQQLPAHPAPTSSPTSCPPPPLPIPYAAGKPQAPSLPAASSPNLPLSCPSLEGPFTAFHFPGPRIPSHPSRFTLGGRKRGCVGAKHISPTPTGFSSVIHGRLPCW